MDLDLPDDAFDDDVDFDDLPPNTLNELENQARLSTSQHPAIAHDAPNVKGGATVILTRDNRNSRPGRPPQPPSSDYGFDDEDVIDLDAQHPPRPVDEVTQREQWRQQRYGAPAQTSQHSNTWTRAQQATRRNENGHEIHRREGSQAAQYNVSQDAAMEHGSFDMDVEALKTRVLELEQERVNLQKSAEAAKSAALAKAGEISIVRANHEKTTKEFERRLAALQSSHAQDAARAKTELENARKEREKIETSNKFLEHDLAQEAEKARTLKRSLKDSHGNTNRTAQGSPFSTPRKNRALAFRDGFNDDEVMMISPSKARDRSKPATPKAGAKRKRAQNEKVANDSPTLSFAEPQPDDEGLGPLPEDSPKPARAIPLREPDQSSQKFELTQAVLSHRSDPNKERAIERLTRYSFPSGPEQSLSAMIYDTLGHQTIKQDFEQYRQKLCDSLMSIWSRCLEESYHPPLYDLTELLQYILMISPPTLSTALIARLIPLCQSTADLVAVPMAKASKFTSGNQQSSTPLSPHIDPLDYINILHLIAINCEGSTDLHSFWSSMEFDFVLLMLHKAQPTDQMIEMLQLLFTSILDDTFGAIANSPPPTEDPAASASTTSTRQSKQQKMENDILDRLTVLLFELPQRQPAPAEPTESLPDKRRQQQDPDANQPASPPPPPTYASLLPLRTMVLDLLQTLSETHHGAATLCAHRLAIPRLVRFLHESILQMYAYFPSSAHPATTACVNKTTLLLTHLDSFSSSSSASATSTAAGGGNSTGTNTSPPTPDVRSKLAGVPGGMQRWLVCLSRVAFAESVSAVEAGLDPEAKEQAHRVLDEMLSPEEGEGVLGVFCSGR